VTSNWQSSEWRAAQLGVKDFQQRSEDFTDHRAVWALMSASHAQLSTRRRRVGQVKFPDAVVQLCDDEDDSRMLPKSPNGIA